MNKFIKSCRNIDVNMPLVNYVVRYDDKYAQLFKVYKLHFSNTGHSMPLAN